MSFLAQHVVLLAILGLFFSLLGSFRATFSMSREEAAEAWPAIVTLGVAVYACLGFGVVLSVLAGIGLGQCLLG